MTDLAEPPSLMLNLTDNVMKIDRALLGRWLQDLRKVMPVVTGKDGIIFTKDGRPLFQFLMNSRAGGLTPVEAYAFAGILQNLVAIVDAAQSQQADFVRLRRTLQTALGGTTALSPLQEERARRLIEETDYLEKSS